MASFHYHFQQMLMCGMFSCLICCYCMFGYLEFIYGRVAQESETKTETQGKHQQLPLPKGIPLDPCH